MYNKKMQYVIKSVPTDDKQALEKLKSMGHQVEQYEEGYNKYFGGVQAVVYDNGKLIGGADSRRDGKAEAN